MFRRVLTALVLTACVSQAAAQDAPALMEYYGDGVHAYFSGDVFESHRLLTQAIENGSRDPRARYFRAMTLLRMGREEEAESDMREGALLEATSASNAYAVDRSIGRLQGRDRLRLEKIRREVRFTVEQQRREEDARRYEETRRREEDVLRRPRNTPLDPEVQPAGGTTEVPQVLVTPPAAEDVESDVIDPGGALPPASVNEIPQADEDPFGSDTDDTDAASTDDPFGEATDPDGVDDPSVTPPAGAESTAIDNTPLADASLPEGDAEVEVGQKVKGTKLVEILGGIFGDVLEAAIPQPQVPPGAFPPMGAEPAGPFGAEDSPFGDDSSDPFGEGDNPFGGAPTDDAEGDPFATGDDPFGASESNPFGDSEDGGSDQGTFPGDADDSPFN